MKDNMSAKGGSASHSGLRASGPRTAGGKIVAISGGFDPVHIGHIKLIKEARALGDKLVVILNNDHWLVKKKGFAFMSQAERAVILSAMRDVNAVVITNHPKEPTDMSVCKELEELKPDIFANGGDRHPKGDPVPEVQLCEKLGIEMVYNIGGQKAQSSSALVKRVKDMGMDIGKI